VNVKSGLCNGIILNALGFSTISPWSGVNGEENTMFNEEETKILKRFYLQLIERLNIENTNFTDGTFV